MNARYASPIRTSALALLATGVVATTMAGTSYAQSVPLAPAKTPITILQTVPVDSAVLSFPDFRKGAAVAIAATNGAGGINGHPLQNNFCDDKVNPTVAAQCVTQGVTAGAVARVSSIGTMGATITPMLLSSNMANFGSIPSVGPEFTSANQFPLSAGSYGYLAFPALMKKKYPAAKTAVILMGDIAGGQGRMDLIVKGAATAGIQILDKILIPTSTVDLSSVAGQVARSNPDMILSGILTSQLIKWWSASQAIGLKIPILQTAPGTTPDVLAQAGAAAAWSYFADYYPDFKGNTPGASTFRAQMAKYAAGQSVTRDAWIAWVGVTAFAAIIKSMKGAVTPATVWGTISRVKCFDVLYFNCLNFSKPGPIADAPSIRVTNMFLLAVKNGNLVSTPYSAAIS